ncbi:MAG: SDR family NAD(P)-dependent oxidoreductase [Alphaproteobacteria bacterium]|nr:SDR family NAD(P)-dependent oxidoreductase [Alphaproteobacteria bacterium]
MKNMSQTILITGASSGIGAALACHYAAPGVTLFLGGRDLKRLEMTADTCREKGATVYQEIVDVTDQDAMACWITQSDETRPLDLMIANAGISGGAGGTKAVEDPEQARRIFDVNLTGILNTIDPVLPRMLARGAGQIALMSSVAGFSGWPQAVAYSASKGAVRLYGEGLRGALASRGVRVNVICPGFVETPMTDVNPFVMPFLMPPDIAARIIARGLARNRGRIGFPWPTYLCAGLLGMLPLSGTLALQTRLPRKPAMQ